MRRLVLAAAAAYACLRAADGFSLAPPPPARRPAPLRAAASGVDPGNAERVAAELRRLNLSPPPRATAADVADEDPVAAEYARRADPVLGQEAGFLKLSDNFRRRVLTKDGAESGAPAKAPASAVPRPGLAAKGEVVGAVQCERCGGASTAAEVGRWGMCMVCRSEAISGHGGDAATLAQSRRLQPPVNGMRYAVWQDPENDYRTGGKAGEQQQQQRVKAYERRPPPQRAYAVRGGDGQARRPEGETAQRASGGGQAWRLEEETAQRTRRPEEEPAPQASDGPKAAPSALTAVEALQKLEEAQLVKLCQLQGLDPKGGKADLVLRLFMHGQTRREAGGGGVGA